MKKDKKNKKIKKKILIPIIIILLIALATGGYLIFKQATNKNTSKKPK